MKLKSLLMLVILLFIGMAFTAPPPAEAQVSNPVVIEINEIFRDKVITISEIASNRTVTVENRSALDYVTVLIPNNLGIITEEQTGLSIPPMTGSTFEFYGKYFIIRTGPENSESNIRIIIGNVKNYNLGSNDNVYWLRTIFELPLTAPEGAFANLRMGGGPTREISYLVFFTDGVWKIINTVN